MRLIQGFFCQGYTSLGVAFAPLVPAASTVRRAAIPVMFAGAIWRIDGSEPDVVVGLMIDIFGQSELLNFKVADDQICFTKRYVRSDRLLPIDDISYVLHKEGKGPWWSGGYSIKSSPRPFLGPARCIITEVDPAPIQADLEKFARDNGFGGHTGS